MHICIGKLNITSSDNGLSPGPRQAIVWNNSGILLWTLGNKQKTYFYIHENLFKIIVWKMAAFLSRTLS